MKRFLFFFPFLWVVFFFGVPCLVVLYVSFAKPLMSSPPFSQLVSYADQSLSFILNLHQYKMLLTNPLYIVSFISSIALSFFSTFICLIIGYAMAYMIARTESQWKHVFLFLIILPFCTSFLIRVYAWMNLLSYQGIVNTTLQAIGIIKSPIVFLDTSFAVGLGIVYCYLPFMILPIYVVLDKIPKDYLEAAFDLGATQWKRFWRITVPLSKNGICAGCIMVFLPAMGEFVIPELMGGNTLTMGRVLFWEFFHHLDWPMACAMAVMIIGIFVIPFTFLQRKIS